MVFTADPSAAVGVGCPQSSAIRIGSTEHPTLITDLD